MALPELTVDVLIIGGGPAGLMAAEELSRSGFSVTVCDAMPTFGRKFLLAGKSGLNITHSEEYTLFRTRFGSASPRLAHALDAFQPQHVRDWAAALGTETFVGTSGRVFPTVMKASPLLRAWLKRLEEAHVGFLPRHRMTGIKPGCAEFETPEGPKLIRAKAILLALGGASWPRLGSDGAWVPLLEQLGVPQAPLLPANCGFDAAWSPVFKERYAGAPVKSVSILSAAGPSQGEFVITGHGVEGSLIYAHAEALREEWLRTGKAHLRLDLSPGRTEAQIRSALQKQSKSQSLSNRLRKIGLSPVKIALLREVSGADALHTPEGTAALIKNLTVPLERPRPIAEAISTAGGIRWDALDDAYMLRALPGLFAAGEMIDWEAPTGGYLLTACFATGRAAARGIAEWLG
ncbi:TIGR03862 family flavoprotein [Rhizobium helianthi]|uniref:TIGR03862 family flavoprotein n=1 Tax=Rhizobium helianthi TaxID=1132695 RepID=A0ABW4M1N9_9HYPH